MRNIVLTALFLYGATAYCEAPQHSPDAKCEYEAFIAERLGEPVEPTGIGRVWEYCQKNSKEAIDTLLRKASRKDATVDIHLGNKLRALIETLPFRGLPERLVPIINQPDDRKVSAMAAFFYAEYYNHRPSESLRIPEDRQLVTSLHFADFAFDFDLHRALQRYARGPDLPSDEKKRRKLIRQSIWVDHLVTDLAWKHRNRFTVEQEAIAECKTLLSSLAEAKHWWARRYVAQVQVTYRFLSDPATKQILMSDSDERVSKSLSATR